MIMNTQPPSFYQRVIDKTKGLAFQSQFIAQNIDKKKEKLAGTVSYSWIALMLLRKSHQGKCVQFSCACFMWLLAGNWFIVLQVMLRFCTMFGVIM